MTALNSPKRRAYSYADKNQWPRVTPSEQRRALQDAWMAGYRSAARTRRRRPQSP